MSFVEFLMQYYFYIVAVLIVLIVGVIGFLVDSKNKNKKKNVVNEEPNSNGEQVANNVNPLQETPINNGLNNVEVMGMQVMQPMGGDITQNQVQPQVQNNDMSMNSILNGSVGIVDNQNASVALNNGILGMEPIINTSGGQGTINPVNRQSMVTNVQPNLNNVQVMGTQVMQPIDVNSGNIQTAVNSNLSDISVLQGIQPTMANNNISNGSMSLDGNTMVMQNMQPNIQNVSGNSMGTLNVQPNVSTVTDNLIASLNAQAQVNNINQSLNNQVQVSSNDINNIGLINGINPYTNIPSDIPTSSVNGVINQINNQSANVGNNVMGVQSSGIYNNVVQPLPNSNMNNPMGGMNGQVYMANSSQPFDISSMFGNNRQ